MFKVLFLFATVLVAALAAPADVDTEGRVVGGTDASPNDAPYQVSLRTLFGHFCGGSILNERTIVSAAHCLVGKAAITVTVVTGTIYLNSGGTKYSVSKISTHPNYNSNLLINDVGVLITSSKIVMSATVAPIALSTGVTAGGASVKLTGWGTTTYPGSAPNTLQKITLSTISVEDCKTKLASIAATYDTQVCTLTKAGEGACHGDSGGPLVGEEGLVGIVSWGSPCAKGLPDVFTRVSSFADWINSHAQN